MEETSGNKVESIESETERAAKLIRLLEDWVDVRS